MSIELLKFFQFIEKERFNESLPFGSPKDRGNYFIGVDVAYTITVKDIRSLVICEICFNLISKWEAFGNGDMCRECYKAGLEGLTW